MMCATDLHLHVQMRLRNWIISRGWRSPAASIEILWVFCQENSKVFHCVGELLNLLPKEQLSQAHGEGKENSCKSLAFLWWVCTGNGSRIYCTPSDIWWCYNLWSIDANHMSQVYWYPLHYQRNSHTPCSSWQNSSARTTEFCRPTISCFVLPYYAWWCPETKGCYSCNTEWSFCRKWKIWPGWNPNHWSKYYLLWWFNYNLRGKVEKKTYHQHSLPCHLFKPFQS